MTSVANSICIIKVEKIEMKGLLGYREKNSDFN